VSATKLQAHTLSREAKSKSDAELLAAVDHGDLTALGALFDRHHSRVRRVLARSGVNNADVDDLVQSTFLELPKIASAFDGRLSAGGWLCGIAVRLASRRRRSIARMLKMLVSFGRVASTMALVDPETEAGDREELAVFAEALATLSPKKRDVFVLVEVEGLATDDVARTLEIPSATVRTRLFHARAELRAWMKRDPA
jgi:RNA polymerase sigma-70 factor (ECF subfamily)